MKKVLFNLFYILLIPLIIMAMLIGMLLFSVQQLFRKKANMDDYEDYNDKDDFSKSIL